MEGLSYEEIRKQRLEENKKRMQELGLAGLSNSLANDASATKTPVTVRHIKPRTPKDPSSVELRRSSRVANSPAPDYREVDVDIQSGRRGYSSRTASLLNRKYASDEARLEATLEAESIMKDLPRSNPSFVKPMLQSHVTGGFWLGLPVRFCKTYLPSKDSKIVLENEKGEEWDTVYLAVKTGLSGGWRGFSLDHGLVDGDALVFELVELLRFKVHIVRVEQSDEPEEDYQKNTTKYASKILNTDGDNVLKDKTDTNVAQHTASLNINSEDDSESMKENIEKKATKRGRPKKVQSPSPSSKSDADEKESFSPPKRGRPKKVQSPSPSSKSDADEKESFSPTKRGRPKKVQSPSPSSKSDADEKESFSPPKRGRPKKNTSVEVSDKQNSAKRGRPKKEALPDTEMVEESMFKENSEDSDKKEHSTRRGRSRKEVSSEENSTNDRNQECDEKQPAKRGRPRKDQTKPAQESSRKRQREHGDDDDADDLNQDQHEEKHITSFLRTQKPHTTRLCKKQKITSIEVVDSVKVC